MAKPPRRLELHGHNWTAFKDHSTREYLLAGPAGTGKTLSNLLKLFWFADEYPGARLLMLRKTRASLSESAMVTWERDVLGEGHVVMGRTVGRTHRHQYQWPNRSVLVCGGLDRPDKVLSTEWDLIYVPEATDLTLLDWETLGGRLRAGAGPFDQLLADCNPTTPNHWLYQRCKGGQTRLYDTTHKDNPRYYDGRTQSWTVEGDRYLARLDQMTGLRRKRFLQGIWASAEGAVYETWNPDVHLCDRFPVPMEWPRYWGIDFGYTNPFVWLDLARDPDGRLVLVRELYRTKRLVEDHARDILRACGAWDHHKDRADWSNANTSKPSAIICDHDAEDRATLDRHLGLGTTAARKAVTVGIQAVENRLNPAGDGKVRLRVMRDSLVGGRDPALSEAFKPTCTADEFGGYVWDIRDGKPPKEEPVKADDHGLDALRYVVMHLDDVRPAVRVW